ncbi:eukaryotic translation initiation factor eIF1-like [Drosophila subobscura]|uniref:eukaryotic translation initiation factor eIF1-like n=1 Tax=Drosophila subobscura TaxID=7241 RepID=UPI00155AA281|nr:eukaryotic translation initiation factor eIF1-like [Drosophila subobscura]
MSIQEVWAQHDSEQLQEKTSSVLPYAHYFHSGVMARGLVRRSGRSGVHGLVHIRIQQRNGRKTLTTVQGLSAEYDLKKIVRSCKKEFACNGTVIEHPEYGEVLQLQGDQRENICQWLTKVGLAKPDQLKVHGF